MVKRLASFTDGRSRTTRPAPLALPAIIREGCVRFERHVGQDRHESKLSPAAGIDQEITAAKPAESRQLTDLLVGNVRPLALPVYDLRRSDGKRPISTFLNIAGGKESRAVEEIINLAIMMHVERRRAIPNVVKDGDEKSLAESDAAVELVSQTRVEKELISNGRDIRHPEEIDIDPPYISP